MAMTSLPSFSVIQAASGGPYLSPDNTEKKPSGVLEFTEPRIFSPRVKFAAEKAKTGDVTLVHIKSCFKNKYWVPHEVEQGVFKIAASANKPQEDTRDPACTLFGVSINSTSKGTQALEFFEISRSLSVVNSMNGMALYDHENSYPKTFRAVDWKKLVVLHDQVAFRSKYLDGNYLYSDSNGNENYRSFQSGYDIGDEQVAHKLIPIEDGNYVIRDLHFNKYWKGGSDLSADYPMDVTGVFSFVKISDNVFALHNLGSNKLCGASALGSPLTDEYPGLSRETMLIVEERVLKRKISNVRYRLDHSIIYDEQVQEVVTEFATNDSPDKENTTTLEFSQTESMTATWNNNESLFIGAYMKVDFEVDEIPFISKTKMEVSQTAEYRSSHECGKSNRIEHSSKASYTVLVPPSTTMKLSLMVSKGACDVPFNNTETVLLTNGEWVTREQDDGMYKGLNTLKFEFHSSEVSYQPGLGQVIDNQ